MEKLAVMASDALSTMEKLLLSRFDDLQKEARVLSTLLGNAVDGGDTVRGKQPLTEKEKEAQVRDKVKQQLMEQLKQQQKKENGASQKRKLPGQRAEQMSALESAEGRRAEVSVSGQQAPAGPRAHLASGPDTDAAGVSNVAAVPAKRKRPGLRRAVRAPNKNAVEVAQDPLNPRYEGGGGGGKDAPVVVVGNIYPSCDEYSFTQTIVQFAQVSSCRLALDTSSGMNNGTGYVTFRNLDDAERFIAVAGQGGVRVGEAVVTAEWKRDFDRRSDDLGDVHSDPVKRAIAEARDLIAEGIPGGVADPSEGAEPDRQLQVYDDI